MTEHCNDDQVVAAAAAFAAGDVTYDETAPATLPPVLDAEPMVAYGLRLPPALLQRIKNAAKQAGIPHSQLVREWIEVGLTDLASDTTVSLSALRRAIAHATQTA